MKKRRRLKKKPVILLIFFISILFIFTFNVTTSRYLKEFSGEASDVVAVPILSLDNPTFSYTNKNLLPGYTDESDFYVNNYDGNNRNEVLMKYSLKIELDSVIPVKVTLTSEDGTEIVLNENKTSEYELPYNTEMRTKFHIKIEWDEKDNSYEYAGKDITLVIDLIAIQVV